MQGKIKNLHQLLIHELEDVYYAEKRILKALAKMEKAATLDDLRMGFEQHARQTEEHIERLEQMFESIGEKAKGHKCDAMDGILEEGESMMKETQEGPVRDAALISSAQRVEHYEIAAYGVIRAFAEQMGHRQIVQLCERTIQEEGDTDKRLSMLAERIVNPAANTMHEGDSEEDMDEPAAMDYEGESEFEMAGSSNGHSRRSTAGRSAGSRAGRSGAGSRGSSSGGNGRSRSGARSGSRAGSRSGGARSGGRSR